MLPVSSPTSANGRLSRKDSGMSSSKQTWKFLRRLYKFKHMDFEFAAWQMLYLFIAPRKVYKNFHYHSQTKHQWARDDPAFLVLGAACVLVSCVLYTIVLKLAFHEFILHLVWVLVFDYIILACAIATAFWFCVNKFMRRPESDATVEWRYSFDVHLNAFLPFLVILHIVQVLLMHAGLEQFGFVRLLSNALWLVAFGYYFYITFLGYFSLPFTHRTVAILYPIGLFAIIFVLSLVFEWHFSKTLHVFVTYRVRT
ncbi:protein unc-50 homolog [Sycon ciliatum]|uniref:protein unc-50 homolog n=1 Tax=Sycon ciliatum TaxID=27933 RepID=UPI0020A9ABD6|eukprot:scpid75407/ scgid16254/ Protein unc-50 homolog